MKATLYVPGKEPHVFLGATAAFFVIPPKVGGERRVNCYEVRVAAAFRVRDVDVLYADEQLAIWGLSNAADYDCPFNHDAEAATMALLDVQLGLCGPILIVEA
jgi:hypothetical protein